MVRSMVLVGLLLIALAGSARSQEDPIPPGIRAGQDAYQQFEAQRRAAAGAQIQLNDLLRNRLPWLSPYGDTIYYAPPGYGYGGYSSYGYGVTMHRPYGYTPQNYLASSLAFSPGTYLPYPSLFAYDYPPPVIRQPIGMRQIQTSPRHWESHPVYADDAVAPPPVPPAKPRAVAPPRETVREIPPPSKPHSGPREF